MRKGGRARRAEPGRAAVWVWPAGAGLFGLGAGWLLAQVRTGEQSILSHLEWPGGADAATTMLQAIVAASISVITLTFSLTVVALQLASQQFSPRLLREFMRDPWTKAVLAVLVLTFVFSLTVLRELDPSTPVPPVGTFVAFVLGLASMAAVLGYINHLVTLLRVDTMMLNVHDEARKAIDAFYPDYDDTRPRSPDELDVDWEAAHGVPAGRSGFVRSVDVEALVEAAEQHDVIIWIDARPGDHVVTGTPLASVSAPGRSKNELEEIEEEVKSAVRIGYERTVEQDSAYGFRQLTDIAVKALSPGINDPVTAAHCVGHMGDLIVRLEGKRLGSTLHEDSEGVGRVVVPDRDLRYYLDLACGQIRRYGSREPTVLVALLRMLRDAATAARSDTHSEEIIRQLDLIVAEVPESMADVDVQQVEDLAGRVRAVLTGDVRKAYQDRAGETRSI